MIDCTVPFQYRRHSGPWLLINSEGNALQLSANGGLHYTHPSDAAPLDDAQIAAVTDAQKHKYYVHSVVASPYPGS